MPPLLLESLPDLCQELSRGMVLGVTHDARITSELFHDCLLGHSGGGIIRSLALNVWAKIAQKSLGCQVVENEDVVDAGNGGDELRARQLVQQGASRAFERCNGPVAVDAHHQDLAVFFGAAQKANMAGVQKVKAAVREGDGPSLTPQPLAERRGVVSRDDFRIHELRMASSISLALTVAVPLFITTRPPAQFATMAACKKLAPAANASVKAAITVSPAPVTSAT